MLSQKNWSEVQTQGLTQTWRVWLWCLEMLICLSGWVEEVNNVRNVLQENVQCLHQLGEWTEMVMLRTGGTEHKMASTRAVWAKLRKNAWSQLSYQCWVVRVSLSRLDWWTNYFIFLRKIRITDDKSRKNQTMTIHFDTITLITWKNWKRCAPY